MRHAVTYACALAAALASYSLLGGSPQAGEPQGKTTPVRIPTERGVKLEGVLHTPASNPSGTIVVFGSGRGYHKDMPLFVRSAEALQGVGVAALRFDWAYHTAGGKHAPDLSTEIQDLDAALAFARKVDGVKRVVLAGKSLGSVAAFMRVTNKSDDIDGLVLLTFPLHKPNEPGTVFEDNEKIQGWSKPLLIVCGDADPYSALAPLYAYCAGFEHAPRLVLAPGDHGFRGPDKEDKEAMEANVDLAARGIARWLAVWAGNFRQADAAK